MYGTQALDNSIQGLHSFENDVNMYGTQATETVMHWCSGLRMM